MRVFSRPLECGDNTTGFGNWRVINLVAKMGGAKAIAEAPAKKQSQQKTGT